MAILKLTFTFLSSCGDLLIFVMHALVVPDPEFSAIFQVWVFLCFLVPWHLLDGICNSTYTTRSKKLRSEHSMCYICPPFHIINFPEVRDLQVFMLAYSPAAVIDMVSYLLYNSTIICFFYLFPGVADASSLVSR